MPRPISITLQDQVATNATTMCLIMRVTPRTPGYSPYGVAMLDREVRYDHGTGEQPYSPIIGFQPTTLLQNSDLSVNNADATGLMPEFDVPVSEEDIIAGVYDFADFEVFQVNYENLVPGSGLAVAAGTFGRVTVQDFGLSIVNELRGLTDPLKQSLCQKDSLTCRATFGSGALGSGADVEELFPCGFDLSTITVSGEVDSVGLETNLTFTDGSLSFADDELISGMIKWLTGANAGRSYELEENTAAGVVTLAFPAAFPIQIGDTFDIRPGCNKHARDEEKGCKFYFASEWVLHFRGEPDIPIGDQGSMETPGASAGPGQGTAVHEPFEEAGP